MDSILSGAQSVANEAHKKLMENGMIQLVIQAKQNYDASVKIYNEVKQLNQGKGLLRNVEADLGAKAQALIQGQKEGLQSDLTYRGNSQIDREIQKINDDVRSGIARKGIQAVDSYGDAINKKSAATAASLTSQAQSISQRSARAQAARGEGVKVAQMAPDMASKAAGLEIQTNSDAVDALNQLLTAQMMKDAEVKRTQINQDREIAAALNFLEDSQGVAKTLNDSFYLVRLSRAPGLFSGTRQSISNLMAMLLGMFLAAGLLYDFARNGRPTGAIIPEVIGLPLVLVIFGLVFYDKALVSLAAVFDALEQTISPGDALVRNTLQVSSQFIASPLNLLNADYALKYLSLLIGSLSWLVSIVFLWVRFAFFCLLYAVGPIFVVMALFEPLRKLTYGWMMSLVHVGLWGVFMRILSLVVVTSGISAFAPDAANDGILKSVFASLVVNLTFLAFGAMTPYFTHLIIGGHLGEKASGMISPLKRVVRSGSPAGGRR